MSWTSTSLTLSTNGLSHVPIKESRNDFEFIVGDATYRCPSLIADFISPKIAALHSIDDTIMSFLIETNDSGGYFGSIVELGRGKSIVLTESNWKIVGSISKELGNMEIYEQILRVIEGELSIDNVVKRMNSLSDICANYENEVRFVSSHLYEISSSDVDKLKFDVFREVVSCNDLKIESEDWLYETISRRISWDFRYFEMFELIRFEFLSVAKMHDYFEIVSNSFEHFTVSQWQSLYSRLIHTIDEQRVNDRVVVRGTLFEPSSPLCGILHHLTSRFGGNVHDRNVVNITANQVCNSHPNYAAKNVADFESNSCFFSMDKPNQSICFDFKTLRIKPTHYTIRTVNVGQGGNHLKNWVIEGSTDGTSWVEIDRHENNTDLNSTLAVKTFTISKVSTFQMIRLRQIGVNHASVNCLCFTAFEIFGLLTGL
jgi:hypothetical protein